MLYSKSTGGFYLPAIHQDTIPADALEISDELYGALLAGQSSGKCIVADAGGYPMLSDAPTPTAAERLEQLRETAKIALSKSDVTMLRCYENGVAVPMEWRSYREELRKIVGWTDAATQPALPAPPGLYPVGS